MLRDMEELLNSVYSLEIKEYLREAMNCYNAHSYRACVILTVIAGSFDLHKKVKLLSKDNPKIRDLDNKVENKKNKSAQYERYLIEQCATADIDMLNEYEKKELLRCLDIRNDSAHPSDYICTAETARQVFSSIIDILASKPVLFGCSHIKIIIDEMKESTFFPVLETQRIETSVSEILSRLHKKATEPFIKMAVRTLITKGDKVQQNNLIKFISYLPKFTADKFESYIADIINKDSYEMFLLRLLYENMNIMQYLSDNSIDRIISKLETNLKAQTMANKEYWVRIVLSEKFQSEQFLERVVRILCAFSASTFHKDVRYQFLYDILCTKEYPDSFLLRIKEIFGKLDFRLEHYENSYLSNILILINDNRAYQHWIKTISESIDSFDFNKANHAAYIFKQLPLSYWIKEVNEDSIVNFVSKVIKTGLRDSFRPYSVSNLIGDFYTTYSELMFIFLKAKFIKGNEILENIKHYINKRYCTIIVSYILACEEISDEIIFNITKYSSEIDLTDFKTNVKERIDQLKDSSIKDKILELVV